MELMGITSVAAITVICYLTAMAVKATAIDNKWIPVICGAMGGIVGIIGFKLMGKFPAEDFVTAFAVGIVSGLAATGANQVYKMLFTKTSGGPDEDGG